jgi:hypothetical protein
MLPEEFAAERRERLTVADDALRPFVETALERFVGGQKGTWANELIDEVVQVWVENFQAEAPGASRTAAELRFRNRVMLGLRKTTDYGTVSDGQIDRVTRWLSTYATNAGTVQGSNAAGRSGKLWVTMSDDLVRDTHEPLDGQIRPVGGTFDVGGTKLAYPGEPVGPPEVWINCRCVAMPAAREGETMSGTTFTLGPEELEDDNPDVVVGNNAFATAVDEEDVAVEPVDEDDLEDSDEDEEDITEIPVHGVAAPEGVPTGDGRMFAIGALTNRDLPLPLLYQPVSTGGHDQAYTVGRLDEIYRNEGEDIVRYRGALILGRQYASEVIEGIIDGTIRGVSVDVDDIELDMSGILDDEGNFLDQEFDPETAGKAPVTVFKSARIAGLTIVSIPAFQEAYIALGHDDEEGVMASAALTACGCLTAGSPELEEEVPELAAGGMLEGEARVLVGETGPEYVIPLATLRKVGMNAELLAMAARGEFAPGTKDGPGWITHPGATARIRRYWVKGEGAAKIRWGAPGDFNRCRAQLAKYVQNPDWLAGLCANMHKEALGIWPAQHRSEAAILASASRAPAAILASARATVYDIDLFAEPPVDLEMPVNIDRDTGRIYGYLAEWGVCHVGIEGVCTSPIPSENEYAYFRKGRVETTEGTLRVGNLTYGTGHPNIYMRASAATEHYDKPDAVRAYVNIGENSRGIWYSGVMTPWSTDADIDAILAIGAFSGDWRDWGNRELDLIAATCVNTPGYQILPALAASGGRQISLTGAGAPEIRHAVTASATVRMDPEEVAAITRTAVAEYRHQEKVAAKLGPVRAAIKTERLARARRHIAGE